MSFPILASSRGEKESVFPCDLRSRVKKSGRIPENAGTVITLADVFLFVHEITIVYVGFIVIFLISMQGEKM